MKTSLIAILFFAFIASATAGSRIVTLHAKERAEVAAGEVAELLFANQVNTASPSSIYIYLGDKGSFALHPNYMGGSNPYVVAGPITLGQCDNCTGLAITTWRISDVASYEQRTNPGSVTPMSSVVIPSEPAGNTEIILESSTDMVTWTAAQPGTYGSSSTKRFFRVRAQRVN